MSTSGGLGECGDVRTATSGAWVRVVSVWTRLGVG